jgi:hypothetical protein
MITESWYYVAHSLTGYARARRYRTHPQHSLSGGSLAQLPQHVWVRNSLNGYLRLYPARVEDG